MISSFRRKQTVRRYSGGYWDDNGEWNDGSYEEITIMASVQPLNQNDVSIYRSQQPEGATVFNAVEIYSNEPLSPGKQELPDGTPIAEADVLVWQGRLWRVIKREDWQSGVINHYRMIAEEIQPKEVEADEDGDEEVSS